MSESEDITAALDLIAEAIIDLSGEVKKLREAIEKISAEGKSTPLKHDTASTRRKKKGEEQSEVVYKSAKELLTAIKEEAPDLHENIKNSKRFKSGDFLVQIEYVDSDTFKRIAREAEALGGKYSKKWRGFIFPGEG